MTTSIRSSAIGTNATGTALSCAIPAGTAAGDVLMVVISNNGLVTLSDNNNSHPLTIDPVVAGIQLPSNGMTVSLYTKTVSSADLTAWGGTLNYTSSVGDRWTIVAVAWQNPNTTAFYDVVPNFVADDGFDPFIDTPTVVTNTANAIHVAIGCPDGPSSAITPPVGYNVEQNGGNEAICVCDLVIATPSTNDATFTISNDGSIGISFAVAQQVGPTSISIPTYSSYTTA